MPDNPTKPNVPVPAPPKPRRFAGGVEPGSLNGRREFYSGPPPIDPDADLLAKVKNMSGSEMRHWLKQSTNRQDYDRALKGVK